MNAILAYIQALSGKQKTTALFTLLYVATILTAGFWVGNDKTQKLITILLFALGAVLGWLTGILISPYDVNEKDRFVKIGQTISVFISGYLLSKIDKPVQAYIDTLTTQISGSTITFALNDLNTVRLIGGLISFLVSAITVYVFRAVEYDLAVTSETDKNALTPDQLLRFKSLLDAGAITQGDYDAQKAKLFS